MGRILSTVGFSSSLVANVKDKKGQYFIGTLLAHKQTASAYKDEKTGDAKNWNIYEFAVEDTDMPTQRKEGKEYIDTTVNKGDTVALVAPARLHNALAQAQIGEKIKIVYQGLGKATSFGGKPHTFAVEVL
jgi:hypothetical protein